MTNTSFLLNDIFKIKLEEFILMYYFFYFRNEHVMIILTHVSNRDKQTHKRK